MKKEQALNYIRRRNEDTIRIIEDIFSYRT